MSLSLIRDPIKKRITAVCLFCFLLGGAVIFRAVQVQIIGDERFERLTKTQFQKKFLLKPRRGTITDRNGEALAVNVESRSIAANPSRIKQKRRVSIELGRALGLSPSQLLKKLESTKSFVWVKRHISATEADRISKMRFVTADGEFEDGIWVVKETKREFPQHETAAHIVGAVDIDSEGVEGVEVWFNERLRGEIVSVRAIKDALGRPTFIDADAAQQIKDGEPVSLTIDAPLQHMVEEELKDSITSTGADSGSVIVMDSVTGELLSIANYPGFDPNKKHTSQGQRRNRALTDGFEPGSTIKPLLMAIAMDHGMTANQTLWGGMGSMTVQGRTISEAETHEKFGWITLKKMVQVSSNVAAARAALQVGGRAFVKGLRDFGFGARTQVGFPGEIAGWLPPEKGLQPLSVANMGFGQGLFVTPLQMAASYGAIHNGGWLVQPTMIRLPKTERRPPKRILSKKIADKVVEALQSVVTEEGTGIKASLPGYLVAGKTGTAQVVDSKTRKYSSTRHISSFIGFAVGVSPKVVVFVSLDSPKGIYYASETAAPLFKRVLAAITHRFSIPAQPELAQIQKAHQNRDGVDVAKKDVPLADNIEWSLSSPILNEKLLVQSPRTKLELVEKTEDARTVYLMPDLKGLSPREVFRTFEKTKIQLDVKGFGFVQSQRPTAGTRLMDGSWVHISFIQ